MAFDATGAVGGGLAGAEAGASFGPIGAVAGGVLGLLGGGFLGGKQIQQYQDPYRAQLDSIIQQLNSGDLGKEFTASAKGTIRQQSLDNLRQIGNSGVGRNAAVLSRLSDKTLTTADQGFIDAQLKGDEYDTQNKLRAAGLMEANREFDYNDFLRRNNEKLTPTPMESLGYQALGSLAGGGAANLGALAQKGLGITPQPTNTPTSGQPIYPTQFNQQPIQIPLDPNSYGRQQPNWNITNTWGPDYDYLINSGVNRNTNEMNYYRNQLGAALDMIP